EAFREAHAAAVEAVVAERRLLLAVAAEQTDRRTQLLIEADADAFANDTRVAVVGPEPETIVAFRQLEGRECVADLGQREQRISKTRGLRAALLEAELQLEAVLRI